MSDATAKAQETANTEPQRLSYTYNPTAITADGKDKMRFELGDTVVSGRAKTSPLCDEEYEAVLSMEKNWKRAKLKCLEAIMMKLSYEVDTSVGGLSYSLGQRAERWKKMYDDLKKELKAPAIPTADKRALYGRNEEHYFHYDMHKNYG